MTRALLDVNVLLALLDADHVDHLRARWWLEAEIDDGNRANQHGQPT